MLKSRLIFSKTDRAIWISHLDTMHLFQRAFVRSGVKICHSEGYNPHPSMSIALPLSVGIESVCEVLDVKTFNTIDKELLNDVLPEGIKVLAVYEPETKVSDIKWLRITAKYSASNDVILNSLFKSDSLIVQKKGKSGINDVDIIPMIKEISFNTGIMSAVISAQNPTLNPNQIVEAIKLYAPESELNDIRIRRTNIYNINMEEFK